MDPLHDPRCLVTTEALFLDGANGVCGASRHGAGEAPPALPLLLFCGVLAIAIGARLRTRSGSGPLSPRSLAAAAVCLVLGALPGLFAIVALRADRPTAVATSAFRVARAHDEVHAFAVAHHGAVLRTETEISIVPVARLALAGVPSSPAAPIDLFDDTLEDGCTERGDVLTCGTPPAIFPPGEPSAP
jgi:hypothetical protein